jgi:hypothetical protein
MRIILRLALVAAAVATWSAQGYAQQNFNGTWELVETDRASVALSPFGKSGSIEHTPEKLSWRNLDRPIQVRNYDLAAGSGTLQTEGGALHNYVVRRSGLAWVIEEHFRGGTNLTVLSLSDSGQLDIVVVAPVVHPVGTNVTKHLAYRRVK